MSSVIFFTGQQYFYLKVCAILPFQCRTNFHKRSERRPSILPIGLTTSPKHTMEQPALMAQTLQRMFGPSLFFSLRGGDSIGRFEQNMSCFNEARCKYNLKKDVSYTK